MKTYLILFCFSLVIFACSSEMQLPNGILKPKQMQSVIFDLLRADEFVSNYVAKDSTHDKKEETIKMYEQVFLIHKVTKDAFYKSYKYYQENPGKNKVIFDSLYNWGIRKKNNPEPIKPQFDSVAAK